MPTTKKTIVRSAQFDVSGGELTHVFNTLAARCQARAVEFEGYAAQHVKDAERHAKGEAKGRKTPAPSHAGFQDVGGQVPGLFGLPTAFLAAPVAAEGPHVCPTTQALAQMAATLRARADVLTFAAAHFAPGKAYRFHPQEWTELTQVPFHGVKGP